MDRKLKGICFLHSLSHISALPQLCRSAGLEVIEVQHQQQLDAQLKLAPKMLVIIAAEQLPGLALSIPKWIERIMEHHAVALFDVQRNSIDPVYWLVKGGHGFIYQEERYEKCLSAIQAMLDGQLWFSRLSLEMALKDLLLDNRRLQHCDCEGIDKLTEREQTIVRLVASGASNKEIAKQLFISDNTVKAHLASVFRKTETRNRAELVGKLW
ncbi:helix-turn-helix transcriptional regulator [Ferrimonas lipolytica]|uniref:Response regulator transcription factor n=1 Tax=Ferrimonas lipolytica TaxID=2724191 RepID=A0A6H1UDN3_9GAMM|nr:response regulator transcription factor [Ferrimonas lipolytica]QIZ77154.1 response regulator transcription factor [Ferrimonas lipolytica]